MSPGLEVEQKSPVPWHRGEDSSPSRYLLSHIPNTTDPTDKIKWVVLITLFPFHVVGEVMPYIDGNSRQGSFIHRLFDKRDRQIISKAGNVWSTNTGWPIVVLRPPRDPTEQRTVLVDSLKNLFLAFEALTDHPVENQCWLCGGEMPANRHM